MNAHEANREQREKKGGMHAENGNFGRPALTRPTPGNRASTGPSGKKNPNR